MKFLFLRKIKLMLAAATMLGAFLMSVLPSFSSDFLVSPPPKSMDKYYAEPGKPSEWIVQMEKMSTDYYAIFASLEVENWSLAEKNVQLFLDSYAKASKMIPEWEEEFDLKSASLLKRSILAKETKKIEKASESIKKSCARCHLKNNNSVWIRYHWPSTETIKALDPMGEKEVSYEVYMEMLLDSLKKISVKFEQGDIQQSWRALDIFTKRLKSLRSVCSKCHVTEWTKSSVSVKDFFVGTDIMKTLHEIKKGFATGEPSKKEFKKNIGYINKRSCKACHLVHQPTAAIQRAW
ncbi:MAG: hypothetical protein VX579_02605, partial [Nitrospinota bacterium]|nr:hypothetical protein [Nitrospinota bacterium]